MSILQNELDESVGKGWRKVIIGIATLIAIFLIASLVFSFWPFSMLKKVANTDSIIQNYQWFYDQHNAIQSQIANLNGLPANAPERVGMTMVLNNSIGEYNSRSKQINRSLWKASDLPYQLPFVGGNK